MHKKGELLKKAAGIIKKNYKYVLIGACTGIANGLFGSGGGTIAVPAMVLLLGLEEHKAHATAIMIILPLTIVSAYFYISNSYVNWELTLKVTMGGILGGYFGAKLLAVISQNLLRKAFGIFMLIAAIRMLI
jgi:uncharacterized protein